MIREKIHEENESDKHAGTEELVPLLSFFSLPEWFLEGHVQVDHEDAAEHQVPDHTEFAHNIAHVSLPLYRPVQIAWICCLLKRYLSEHQLGDVGWKSKQPRKVILTDEVEVCVVLVEQSLKQESNSDEPIGVHFEPLSKQDEHASHQQQDTGGHRDDLVDDFVGVIFLVVGFLLVAE
jgi:hypothetical protein